MASPSKRPKIENLTDHLTSSHDNVDTHLKCCIYHAGKKEHEETVKELEKWPKVNIEKISFKP